MDFEGKTVLLTKEGFLYVINACYLMSHSITAAKYLAIP